MLKHRATMLKHLNNGSLTSDMTTQHPDLIETIEPIQPPKRKKIPTQGSIGVSMRLARIAEVRRYCAYIMKTPSEWARGLVEAELERIKREENMT
jgi:hypothetical protein